MHEKAEGLKRELEALVHLHGTLRRVLTGKQPKPVGQLGEHPFEKFLILSRKLSDGISALPSEIVIP